MCDKKFCRNCKLFYGTETSVDEVYTNVNSLKPVDWDSGSEITGPPNLIQMTSDWSPIKMCQHDTCFNKPNGYYENGHNNMYIDEKTFTPQYKRIKGQAQLNQHGNCKFYERKWWKFWIRN